MMGGVAKLNLNFNICWRPSRETAFPLSSKIGELA